MSEFTPAPAAIVRVAGWSLQSLQPLAAPSLATQAAALSEQTGDGAAQAAYRAAYQATLDRQRRYLWRATAGDARFRCALALSSPSLAARLDDGAMPERRNKRARHLEKSLYRYLARAVSRIDPHGLWTGVTLASFGDDVDSRFGERAARSYFAVELGPLRALLQALSAHEPYRSRGPYRLNPTLQNGADGVWRVARRRADGALDWRSLPASPLWPLLRQILAGQAPASLDELRARLAESLPAPSAAAALQIAEQAGLLLGGLAWPARYHDPADALRQVEALLLEPQRAAWRELRLGAEHICRQTADYVDALLARADPAAAGYRAVDAAQPLLDANAAVAELIRGLADAWRLPCPSLPQALLRCDLAAPYRIELGRADQRRLDALLDDWATLERGHDGAGRHRRRLRRILRGLDAGGSLTARPEIDADSVTPVDGCTAAEAQGPPLGALIVRPGRDGLDRPWVRGLSDVASATHARHAYHLRYIGDPLTDWFRRSYRELELSCGVTVADLVYQHPGSPNVLARPAYCETLLDPWGATPRAEYPSAARLRRPDRASALFLDDGGRRLAVHVFTAMSLPSNDIVVERLAATSYNWRNDLPSNETETEFKTATPTRLAGGSPLKPRRTELSDADIEALTAARGAERFRIWQRLATTYRWPPWVRVVYDDAPALMIPSSGPLALEVAFEGVHARHGDGRRRRVGVEDVIEDGWLSGPLGDHMAELVLPVRRRRHFWQMIDSTDSTDSTDSNDGDDAIDFSRETDDVDSAVAD